MSVRLRVAVVAVLALIAGCAASTQTAATAPPAIPPLHTISGVISVVGSTLGSVCAPKPGYDDIREGAPVTVRDGSGTIIATSALGTVTSGGPGACEHRFVVSAVPDSGFYTVEVARRGGVTFSLALGR